MLNLLFLLPGPALQEPAPPPNVVILVADDMNWDDMPPKVPMPNVERLAEEGLTFRRAYSMPSCAITRYTLMFGRYGRRDGIGSGINALIPPSEENPCPDPALVSLPDVFRMRGYSTALFGKWHLGSVADEPPERAPLVHGFDHWRAGSVGNLKATGAGYFKWARIDDGVTSRTTEYATVAVRDSFVEWWGETEGPKLAFVGFHAPHPPVHAPPEELLPEGHPQPKQMREKYEATLTALDTAIGQMLDVVDLADTLVLFLSDNGTPPVARGEREYDRLKGTCYEGGVHVPFIVAGPGVARGAESNLLVHTVDVLATLAAYIGQELPEGAAEDSVSFQPAFEEGAPFAGTRNWVFVEIYDDERDDKAVILGAHKLRVSGRGSQELYYLEEDPGELRPRSIGAIHHRGLMEEMRAIMDLMPPRK